MKTSSSESDFGDYLSNLRKKTAGKKTDFHIDGLSDFSLSELSDKKDNTIPINSKFLKNTPEKVQVPKTKSKNDKHKKKKKEKNSKKTIKNKENISKANIVQTKLGDFSDSDMNFSLSFSLKENKTDKKTSDQVPKLQLNSSKKKITDSDNDESSFGKDGNRFIKRQKPEPVIPLQLETEPFKRDMSDDILSARDISSPRKSTLRSARSSNSKKKVTIMETKQQGSLSSLEFENSNSFEEINKSKSISESDQNDQSFCGMNIMSFNDLVAEEANEISVEEIIPENDYYMPYGNIMSIEELEEGFNNKKSNLSVIKNVRDSSENSDSMSEIKTIPSATPRKISNILTNQSISEVISIPQKDRSENGSMHSKHSKAYSTDFDDSKIESIKTSQSITKKKNSKSPSYSNDFTEDDTLQSTSQNVSVIKQVPKNKIKTHESDNDYMKKSKSTQKHYIPSGIGMQTVEPVPIAHYVVSPEALECLSAYSPSMLLMTNMLRQQIELTKNFIETHERLYESLIDSIHPTYKYSNLKETKEFIKRNKPKPLTMKEALKLVENEN